ncbi:MAG TPA: hypothetical protein VFU25_04765, partial [Ornithinibacter sp.]|nr:hypothetical protein [Ornithinibacter sp.]
MATPESPSLARPLGIAVAAGLVAAVVAAVRATMRGSAAKSWAIACAAAGVSRPPGRRSASR